MKLLIMMLYNIAKQTFHPIFYLENPLPGNPDNLTRYKSKMHHTTGFTIREDAMKSINEELLPKVKSAFPLYNDIVLELESELQWDGIDLPADIQIRNNVTESKNNS